MTKLDEVSEAIGQLRGNMKTVLKRTKNIESQLKVMNGVASSNRVRLDEIERHKWTVRKASAIVGLAAALFTIGGTVVVFALSLVG